MFTNITIEFRRISGVLPWYVAYARNIKHPMLFSVLRRVTFFAQKLANTMTDPIYAIISINCSINIYIKYQMPIILPIFEQT